MGEPLDTAKESGITEAAGGGIGNLDVWPVVRWGVKSAWRRIIEGWTDRPRVKYAPTFLPQRSQRARTRRSRK